MEIPVVLHIPHAAREIPAEHRSLFVLADEEVEAERLRHTDAFTDELFELRGAERVVFPVSRLLVDPERFRSDTDEIMSRRGLGAVYTKTADGRELKRVPDREALLQEFYDPHHQLLESAVDRALDRFGRCLIVDCHSFPSVPLPCDLDQDLDRPDACLGTDEMHTSPALIDAARKVCDEVGWTCEFDRPYAGTIVPIKHFRRNPDVWSIMVEINRRQYMDETTGRRSPEFSETRRTVSLVLQALADA